MYTPSFHDLYAHSLEGTLGTSPMSNKPFGTSPMVQEHIGVNHGKVGDRDPQILGWMGHGPP